PDQTHGATAKSCSGHAAPNHAFLGGNSSGNFNQDIEFATTDLVVIAQRLMAGKHQPTHNRPTTGADCFGGLESSLIFLNYMPRTPKYDRIQLFSCLAQVLQRDIAKRGALQNTCCHLAFRPAFGVLPVRELVTNMRVEDENCHPGIPHRNRSCLASAAIK